MLLAVVVAAGVWGLGLVAAQYTRSLFVVFLGFTTTMCFVARAVFDLAGG